MPSVRRQPLFRATAVAACAAVLGASAAGCETTQDKAAKQQARAEHILKARAERQKAKKRQKAKARAHGKHGAKNGKDKGGKGR